MHIIADRETEQIVAPVYIDTSSMTPMSEGYHVVSAPQVTLLPRRLGQFALWTDRYDEIAEALKSIERDTIDLDPRLHWVRKDTLVEQDQPDTTVFREWLRREAIIARVIDPGLQSGVRGVWRVFGLVDESVQPFLYATLATRQDPRIEQPVIEIDSEDEWARIGAKQLLEQGV